MPNTTTTKSRVARLLANSQEWISGESISNSLGISRAAVAKHIASLRAEGYLIDALPRRGYLCRIVPDPINPEDIKKRLTTRTLGRAVWLCLPEIDSTNQEAVIRASDGLSEGSVVLAERQTMGRGRKGRFWHSLPRSVYLSVVIRPKLRPEKLPWLMIAAALAIHQTLMGLATDLEPRIKWPNDVYLGDQKCAGILVEAGLSGGDVQWAVIGLGLNLNAAAEDFPEEIRAAATSLFEKSGTVHERNLVCASLLNDLEKFLKLILAGQSGELADCWLEASYLAGKSVKINAAEECLEGRVLGLDENGRLIIRQGDGIIRTIESGDITIPQRRVRV